jgi:O-antigen/teichoic acid export membrane protein
MMQHRSSYWRNVLTVLGGALGAQALPLLVAPLITRLCTPADMGTFSVWLGVVAVTAIAATLRMETAMILDHDAKAQQTCFGVVCDTASITAIGVTLFAACGHLAGWPIVGSLPWTSVVTIGLGTWLTAMMQTTLAYATSHRAFGKAARAKVIGAGTIALGQLALLYAGGGGAGLLAGQLVGLAAGLAAAHRLLAPPPGRPGTSFSQEGRAYLHRHRAFWHFSLPSNLLNALVGQLPLLMIGMRYGVLSAGLFALTQRVLAAPISLLAASVLEVFKRQSVHDFQTLGNCSDAYRYTFKTLLSLGVVPFVILFLCSPALFAWIFGEAWRQAGELAQILAPLYFLNFIASPLSYVFFVAGKQKMELIWQVALFTMTVAVFIAPGTLQQSVLRYAIGYSGLYLIYMHMSYQCAQNRGVVS